MEPTGRPITARQMRTRGEVIGAVGKELEPMTSPAGIAQAVAIGGAAKIIPKVTAAVIGGMVAKGLATEAPKAVAAAQRGEPALETLAAKYLTQFGLPVAGMKILGKMRGQAVQRKAKAFADTTTQQIAERANTLAATPALETSPAPLALPASPRAELLAKRGIREFTPEEKPQAFVTDVAALRREPFAERRSPRAETVESASTAPVPLPQPIIKRGEPMFPFLPKDLAPDITVPVAPPPEALVPASMRPQRPTGFLTTLRRTEPVPYPAEYRAVGAKMESPIGTSGERPGAAAQGGAPRTPAIPRAKTFADEARDMDVVDLLKNALEETGAVGKFTPEQLAARARAKAVRKELYRRVTEHAATTGKALVESAEELGIDPARWAAVTMTLGRDRSQPLVAGTGLRTGKTVQDRLSYRPDKLTGPEDVVQIIRGMADQQKEFSEARVSKGQSDVTELARDVGLDVDTLRHAKPGSIANSETIYAARQLSMNLAQDLRQTVTSLDTATATPEQLAQFQTKYLNLMGVLKAVAGFRTEASNIFRQFQQSVGPNDQTILASLLNDLKQANMDAPDLTAFMRKTRELSEPTLSDKLWHLWYANILSGPTTHFKNILGNASQLIMETARVASTTPKELPAAIAGVMQGLRKGVTEAADIWRHGERNKFEERGTLPIVFKGKAKWLNVFDYVGRSLSAADAVFRGGFRGLEAGGKALQTAQAAGQRGLTAQRTALRTVKTQLEQLFEDPDVVEFGRRGTYTQNAGGLFGMLSDAIAGVHAKYPNSPTRLIVPFSRIVANVMNNGLDWTPVGTVRAMGLGKGKITKPFTLETARQRHQQLARSALGTLGMIYFASKAADGKLSGNGPSDYRKRMQMEAAGWRPNALYVGGKWRPYTHWGPVAIPMAIAGNFFDAQRYTDMSDLGTLERASAATMGTLKTVLDMSFLSNLSDFIASIEQAEQKGAQFVPRFVAQQVLSGVPNFVKQIARYFDPTVYDAQSVRDRILSSLRMTSGLKPKLNIWGEVMRGDHMPQLSASALTKDPVKQFLLSHRLWITVPSKATTIKDAQTGDARAMTDAEYYEYIKRSGPKIYEKLKQQIGYLENIDDPETQQDMINEWVQDIRKKARTQISREGGIP